MTRLTRETALALIPSRCMQPNICRMIIHTTSMSMAAAHMFRPNISTVTKNTAAEGLEIKSVTSRTLQTIP